jgi:hypothetical protein
MNIDISNAHCGLWILFLGHIWLRVATFETVRKCVCRRRFRIWDERVSYMGIQAVLSVAARTLGRHVTLGVLDAVFITADSLLKLGASAPACEDNGGNGRYRAPPYRETSCRVSRS